MENGNSAGKKCARDRTNKSDRKPNKFSNKTIQILESKYVPNFQILTTILQKTPVSLKDARLVCKFWNDMVLTLPNTRFAFTLNDEYERRNFEDEETELKADPLPFFAICSTLDRRLAKRIRATCDTAALDTPLVIPCINTFAAKLLHFCDKFTDIMQILEFSSITKTVYHLSSFKRLLPEFETVTFSFSEYDILNRQILPVVLTPKPNLTMLKLNSQHETTTPSLIQLVINVSPNLREVTIPWGVYPDFAHTKRLDSLTIALSDLYASDIGHFNPAEFSRMLRQVDDQLVTLCFGETNRTIYIFGTRVWNQIEFRLPRKMPKLRKFRNVLFDVFRCDDVLADLEKMPALETLVIGKTNATKSTALHEFLQRIFDADKILGGVKDLTIIELYDPNLLAGVKTAFPNLVNLRVRTFTGNADWSEMKLGVVLQACTGWKGLKRLELMVPSYPRQMVGIIQALFDAMELFKGQYFSS